MTHNIAVVFLFMVVAIVVHTEIHALFKGIMYCTRFKNATLYQKAWIVNARYQFESFMWHESYCYSEGLEPAYKVVPIMGAMLGTIIACGVAGANGVDISPDVYVSGSFAAGIAYFMTAYGKAFNAWREIVRKGGTQETWKYA